MVLLIIVILVAGFILFMSSLTATDSDTLSIGLSDRILTIIYPAFKTLDSSSQMAVSIWFDGIIREAAHFV